MRRYGSKRGRPPPAYQDVLCSSNSQQLPARGPSVVLTQNNTTTALLDVGIPPVCAQKTLASVRPSRTDTTGRSRSEYCVAGPLIKRRSPLSGIHCIKSHEAASAASAEACWTAELRRNRLVGALLHRQTTGAFPTREEEQMKFLEARRFVSAVKECGGQGSVSEASASIMSTVRHSALQVVDVGGSRLSTSTLANCGQHTAATSSRPWRLYTRSPGRLTASMAHLLARTQPGLRRVVLLGFLRSSDLLLTYSYGYGFAFSSRLGAGAGMGAGTGAGRGAGADEISVVDGGSSLNFELQLWSLAPHLPSLTGCATLQSAPQAGSRSALPLPAPSAHASGLPAVALLARVPLWPGAADGWVKSAGLGSVHLLDPTAVRLSVWEAPADGTLVVNGWLPASWRAPGASRASRAGISIGTGTRPGRSDSSEAAAGSSGAMGRLPISHHITVVPPLHRKMAPLVRRAAVSAQAEAQAQAEGSLRLLASTAGSAPGRARNGNDDSEARHIDTGTVGGVDEDEVLARVLQASEAATGMPSASSAQPDAGDLSSSGTRTRSRVIIAPVATDLSEEGSISSLRALHTSLLVCAPFPRQTVAGLVAIRIAPQEATVASDSCEIPASPSSSSSSRSSAALAAHVVSASARLGGARCLHESGICGYRLALNTGDGLRVLTLLSKPAGPALPPSLHLLPGVMLQRQATDHHDGPAYAHADADTVTAARTGAFAHLVWSACARSQGAIDCGCAGGAAGNQLPFLAPAPWSPSPSVVDLLEPISVGAAEGVNLDRPHTRLAEAAASARQINGSCRLWPIGCGFQFKFDSTGTAAAFTNESVSASLPLCYRKLRLDLTYAACAMAESSLSAEAVGLRHHDDSSVGQGRKSKARGLLPSVVAAADSAAEAAAAVAVAAAARAHKSMYRATSRHLELRRHDADADADAVLTAQASAAPKRRRPGEAVVVSSAATAQALLAVGHHETSRAAAAEVMNATLSHHDRDSHDAVAAANVEAAALSLAQQRTSAAAGFGTSGDVVVAGAVGLDAEALLRRLLAGRLCNYDLRLAALLDSRQAAAWGICGISSANAGNGHGGPATDHTGSGMEATASQMANQPQPQPDGDAGQRHLVDEAGVHHASESHLRSTGTGHPALTLSRCCFRVSNPCESDIRVGMDTGTVHDVTPGPAATVSQAQAQAYVAPVALASDDARIAVFVAVADHEGAQAVSVSASASASAVVSTRIPSAVTAHSATGAAQAADSESAGRADHVKTDSETALEHDNHDLPDARVAGTGSGTATATATATARGTDDREREPGGAAELRSGLDDWHRDHPPQHDDLHTQAGHSAGDGWDAVISDSFSSSSVTMKRTIADGDNDQSVRVPVPLAVHSSAGKSSEITSAWVLSRCGSDAEAESVNPTPPPQLGLVHAAKHQVQAHTQAADPPSQATDPTGPAEHHHDDPWALVLEEVAPPSRSSRAPAAQAGEWRSHAEAEAEAAGGRVGDSVGFQHPNAMPIRGASTSSTSASASAYGSSKAKSAGQQSAVLDAQGKTALRQAGHAPSLAAALRQSVTAAAVSSRPSTTTSTSTISRRSSGSSTVALPAGFHAGATVPTGIASRRLVGSSGSIIRSRVVAALDVVTGAVRVIECRRLPPRLQPAFDGQARHSAPASAGGGSPALTVQSLSSITSESLAAVRARFLGPRLAISAAPDAWCCGRGSVAWAGAGVGVRELDNSSVCAGKSLAALAHPLYPLALVAPTEEEEEDDEDAHD